MIVNDFEYAGEFLSDWGFILCSIDSSNGFETITTDSQLTFDSISQFNGKYLPLTTSYYTDHIEISLQICKKTCPDGIVPFTVFEVREVKRWLNRPSFHKFKLIQPNWADIYMNGSFNVSEIKFNDITYALDLTFISDRPFALNEPLTYKFDIENANDTFTFFDTSDEIGHIYPQLNIKCLSDGDLIISNSQEAHRETVIKNVTNGEDITCTPNLIISNSISSHYIQNDFNFQFVRICNSYENRKNILSFSLPCKVELTYSPYVKVVS